MTVQYLVVEVLPGSLQLLIIAGHQSHVVEGSRRELSLGSEELLHQRPHHLLRGFGGGDVREDVAAVRFLSVAHPAWLHKICINKWDS